MRWVLLVSASPPCGREHDSRNGEQTPLMYVRNPRILWKFYIFKKKEGMIPMKLGTVVDIMRSTFN